MKNPTMDSGHESFSNLTQGLLFFLVTLYHIVFFSQECPFRRRPLDLRPGNTFSRLMILKLTPPIL